MSMSMGEETDKFATLELIARRALRDFSISGSNGIRSGSQDRLPSMHSANKNLGVLEAGRKQKPQRLRSWNKFFIFEKQNQQQKPRRLRSRQKVKTSAS